MKLFVQLQSEGGGRFSYRLDRARPGDKVIDWRCTYTNSKCKGRLRTDNTESVVIHTKYEHCHAACWYLGQEMGYEISTSQMQHDAADKQA